MHTHPKPYAKMVGSAFSTMARMEEHWNFKRLIMGKQHTGHFDIGVSAEEIASMLTCANELVEVAAECRMAISIPKIMVLRMVLTLAHHPASREVETRSREVRQTMIHEFENIMFMRATGDMLEFSGKGAPFGELVRKGLFDCASDISEACECFAFERYAACVFHLGRAMELATKRLAKTMKVGKSDDDWQGYLKAIKKAGDAMPRRTQAERDKRAPYQEAVALSVSFKKGWRNPTAHKPERTYTRQQALDVMNSAKAFMDTVAQKILKVKVPKTS